MADEPTDYGSILARDFGVPSRPVAARSEVARRFREWMGSQPDSAGWRAAFSEEPVSRGALLDIVGVPVPFPEAMGEGRAFAAFIDRQPDAKWEHEATYVFVAQDGTGPIHELVHRMPPAGGPGAEVSFAPLGSNA